jgi:hypothetical protein
VKMLNYAGPIQPDPQRVRRARRRKLIILGKVMVCVGSILTLAMIIYLLNHQPDERFRPLFPQ